MLLSAAQRGLIKAADKGFTEAIDIRNYTSGIH